MPLIAHRADRYLRAPRLCADADGGARLSVIAWQAPDGERVVHFDLDAVGQVRGENVEALCQPSIIALHPRDGQPTRDADVDRVAFAGPWQARVERGGGVSRVIVTLPSGSEVVVLDHVAIVAAPALARAAGGVWLAFHHNVREDNGEQDIAKWIALRFIDDAGDVYEPTAPMTDRDRDRGGEEQSFEFPSLVVGRDGAVALFGRGSHNFYRQDLSDAGFGPRVALSDGEWGSRGRWVAATVLADRHVLIARRERKGIEVTRLPPVAGNAPHLQRVTVDTGTSHGSQVVSASTRAHELPSRDGRFTLFGDIQQHSAHSDGVGSADEAYLRARDVYADDFVALTDHESFLGKRTGPGEWGYLQAVADRYEEPGRFNTLIAYEWTGARYPGPGHKCVYYPTPGAPIVSRDDVPVGAEAVAKIRALGGIASPHHIGWTGADEAGHEPNGQPLWEICSVHGCYEHVDHPLGQRGDLRDQMADEMLRRGHRFGFTASSDSHGLLWHHGESRKRDPYRTGLTAVQATDRTRAAIFAALIERRCYATSGAKIFLDVTVNDAPMGSEITASDPVTVRVDAIGTTTITRVDLMGRDGVLTSVEVNDQQAHITTTLQAPVIYARVVQQDGEMAWSSPVFVDAA